MRKVVLAVLGVVLLALAVAALGVYAAGRGWFGAHEEPGISAASRRPPEAVAASAAAVAAGAERIGVARPRQILFGDLHVHTTFSFDAFMLSLPLAGGEGAHPPADACDFARFCSALDFWSINDHAEGVTPRHWRETVQSIRQCNDVAGDPRNPDTVAFLGWEWTQVGATPDDHFGHKNVVLRGTDDDEVPVRPIAAGGQALAARQRTPRVFARGLIAATGGDPRYRDFARYLAERDDWPVCADGVDVRDLPPDCFEVAETPADLYRKLDQWGMDSLVIPHGTTWGFYTPPGSTWDKQLRGAQNDPDRQALLEVYSGHGDGEVYREWRAVERREGGAAACPEPRDDYLPTCWRAGEIVEARCRAEGHDAEECASRAEVARANAAAAGVPAHLTVPGAKAEEWLDAGQCRDCRQPSFNYRPGGSAQYILAIRDFEAPDEPSSFRMGFIGSSDNHFARPGTGYKEVQRRGFTESNRVRNLSGVLARGFRPPEVAPRAESVAFDPGTTELAGFQLVEFERQASFFVTGGLAAVHAEGRDRDAIWEALVRREVYGTSGPRILLWFDLLNPPGSIGVAAPMGSAVAQAANPIFQVRAVGSFEQEPGCPETATTALSPERLASVCRNECYNPSDARRLITRIEIVRVRPQAHPDEPLDTLIDDPWRTFPCEPDPAGCAAVFSDPDFTAGGREAVYYARVFEEPKPSVNGDGLRCVRDAEGRCTRVDFCGGPGAEDDDCLGMDEPRAWSSPIWVDFAPGSGRPVQETAVRAP